MKTVGVIGASGIAASELLLLLQAHPSVKITLVHSSTMAGKCVAKICNDFVEDLVCGSYSAGEINDAGLDAVFLCGHAGSGMQWAPFLEAKVVDLSPDYRFKKKEAYEGTYGLQHSGWLEGAGYGLPELFGTPEKVAANPGCYATGALLALVPLCKKGLLDFAVVDGKSGYSGAGKISRTAEFKEKVSGNAWPYKVTGHRHEAEIQQFIGAKVHFTPHVLPAFRGMLCTVHAFLEEDLKASEAFGLYEKAYAGNSFVSVQKEPPDLRCTANTNNCVLGGFEVKDKRLVVTASLDNLGKGAAGQAVQNMNRLLGLKDSEGLVPYAKASGCQA